MEKDSLRNQGTDPKLHERSALALEQALQSIKHVLRTRLRTLPTNTLLLTADSHCLLSQKQRLILNWNTTNAKRKLLPSVYQPLTYHFTREDQYLKNHAPDFYFSQFWTNETFSLSRTFRYIQYLLPDFGFSNSSANINLWFQTLMVVRWPLTNDTMRKLGGAEWRKNKNGKKERKKWN